MHFAAIISFFVIICVLSSVELLPRNRVQKMPDSILAVQMEQEREISDGIDDEVISDMIQYWKYLKQLHATDNFRTDPLKIVQFSWSDCAQSDSPMHISQLSIGPDPLKLPGNVSITAHGTIKEGVIAPIQVSLEVYKKILVWVKIPCIDGLGSCTYTDGCAIDPFHNKPCPPIFAQKGLPCKCPVKQGSYAVDNLSLLVNPAGVPGWLEDGSYRVTARLAKNGKEFGCVNLAFSITK